MELLAIVLIFFIINIIIVAIGGAYLHYSIVLKRLDHDNARLLFDKYKFDEEELNKANLERLKYELELRRLEEDIRLKEKELDIRREELYKNMSVDMAQEFIETIDTLIRSFVETYIKSEYTNPDKPLDESNFNDIIIPTGTKREDDEKMLFKKIVDDMPIALKEKMNKYMLKENRDFLIGRMIKIYYSKVVHELRKVKMQMAIEDNAMAARKKALFTNGRVNPDADITEEERLALEYYGVRNIRELEICQNSYRNDPNAYVKAKPLMGIDISKFRR